MDTSTMPAPVASIVEKLFQTMSFQLPGGFVFEPNILQALLVVILIFMLIYMMGHLRHTYVGWSVKGILPGLSFGFALALLLEGLFIVGGKTVFTELIGWENAPKPISTVIDTGREKLVTVLGVDSEVPESSAKEPKTAEEVISTIQNLEQKEQEQLQRFLCHPGKEDK